jgi:hypothetical protein
MQEAAALTDPDETGRNDDDTADGSGPMHSTSCAAILAG